MSRKVKLGPAGRFGVRYGKRIREEIYEIEKIQRKLHNCPRCKMKKVKRISTSIYYCKKCKLKFAGKAYFPF